MKLYMKESEDFEQYTYVKSKTVYDYDGFTTEYTMYYDEVNDKYVFVFGDSDFYNPNDGYEEFDWECDTEQEADEWFESYKGYEDDLDESLKENVNKKYNWFLVSNNYGKTVSVLPESDCDRMIEDFVINMLFDEVVTDEADEDLYDENPEKFYQKYDVEEQIRAVKYDLTSKGDGLKVSSGRYIIIKDSDYEGDLPYNYYIENGCLYNPSDNCVGKLENVTTKPNTTFSDDDIHRILRQWLDVQSEVESVEPIHNYAYHVYGKDDIDYNTFGKLFEEYFKKTFGWNVSHGDSTRIKYIVSCLQPSRSKGVGFDITFTQEDDYDDDEMYVEIEDYMFDLTDD